MKPQKRQNDPVMSMAMGGMLAALVLVATSFFHIPVSVTQGYIHLGDGFILLGAALLGWVAVPAAAIGSMLADLLAGYTLYCLPTFLIKGAVAAIAVLGLRDGKPYWVSVLMMALAELAMVAGYFVTEWLILGYGLPAAAGAVIPNLVQAGGGVVIGAALVPLFRRVKLPGVR